MVLILVIGCNITQCSKTFHHLLTLPTLISFVHLRPMNASLSVTDFNLSGNGSISHTSLPSFMDHLNLPPFMMAVSLVIVSPWTIGKCWLPIHLCIPISNNPPKLDLPTYSVHIDRGILLPYVSAADCALLQASALSVQTNLDTPLLTKGLQLIHPHQGLFFSLKIPTISICFMISIRSHPGFNRRSLGVGYIYLIAGQYATFLVFLVSRLASSNFFGWLKSAEHSSQVQWHSSQLSDRRQLSASFSCTRSTSWRVSFMILSKLHCSARCFSCRSRPLWMYYSSYSCRIILIISPSSWSLFTSDSLIFIDSSSFPLRSLVFFCSQVS